MKPEQICDKLADLGEDVCQLRAAVGETPDGLATRLAKLQDSIFVLRADIAGKLNSV